MYVITYYVAEGLREVTSVCNATKTSVHSIRRDPQVKTHGQLGEDV